MTSTDKMIDDVRRGCIAPGTAEPLAASQALDNAAGRVYATVSI